MGAVLVTPAASQPVTLAEAKAQCRVAFDDDDTLINGLIAAATAHVERYTGRGLVTQTWRLTLDSFADEIRLPFAPVQSVTSIQYTDPAGSTQTLSADAYSVDVTSEPARIVRVPGAAWPETTDGTNAVRITYAVGYSTIPAPIKHAILLLVEYFYDNGQAAEPPMAIDALLSNYRVHIF